MPPPSAGRPSSLTAPPPPDLWQGDGFGVVTRAEHPPRACTGVGTVGEHFAAADEDVGDPLAGGAEPLAPSRQIAPHPGGPAAPLLGIEYHQIGAPPRRPPPAPRQAVVTRGPIGHHFDGLLDREQAALTHHLTQHDRRV